MAEDLYPTPTRLGLLADIAAQKVADDADGTPWLDCGGGELAKVGAAIWEMERVGWVDQAPDGRLWHLTDRGRDVLQGVSDG